MGLTVSNLLAAGNTGSITGDKRAESRAARKAIAAAIKAPTVIDPTDADAEIEPNVVFEFDNGRTGYNIAGAIVRGKDKLVDAAKDADVTLVASYAEGDTLGGCINHVSSDENYKALSDADRVRCRAFAKDDAAYLEFLELHDIAYTAEHIGTLTVYAYKLADTLSDDELAAEEGYMPTDDSDESAE